MNRRKLLVLVAIIVIVILIIAKCNCRTEPKLAVKVVNPPIPTADIPFKEYEVDAAKGDTIVYPSGSVLLFPKDAFVDKNGKLIEGKVNIKYREFADPVDQFLSGIPMEYDSAGVKYTFESAGMCDIQAFKDGKPVFVNKENKPVINIVSQNTDLAQNLYFLDTIKKQWINRGKSEVLELGKIKIDTPMQAATATNFQKPIRPSLLDDELPIIKVNIDTASFDELKSYHNLQFQLDKSENRFSPQDATISWDDIKLVKGIKNGLYNIRFSKAFGDYKKSVEYKVKPVLNEKDYAKALLAYDKQMAAYEKKIAAREAADKANREAYVKDSIENSAIDKDNAKTAALNKIIEAKNAEIDAKNKIEEEKEQAIINQNMQNRVRRNFEIDGFGVWNCDRAFIPGSTVTIKPFYVNNNDTALELYAVNLLIKDLNTVVDERTDKIKIPLDATCMMVGVYDGRFAYITYDEFKQLNITKETEKMTIPMHIVGQENNNAEFIRSIVRQ